MEARAAIQRVRGRPAWLVGLVPLVLLALVIGVLAPLDLPGLERRGVPVEDLAVDRTVLRPGEIKLHLRNDGPDAVSIEQAIVNDGFAGFSQTDESIGRLDSGTVRIRYPWIEGESYEVKLLTATGGTVDTSIESAAETPEADVGFYGLMALVGFYVGIIPVAIGMLWLPWIRRVGAHWVRFLLAVTVGLLAFLAIDAVLEGLDFASKGAQAFGGAVLVWLGAAIAYLALAGVDGWVRGRSQGAAAAAGFRLALLVAIGVGLHNLGEGLAIGSAYAIGSLALGATLIVGFALHNTTEGLAIVAPIGKRDGGRRVSLPRLAALGLIAGGPAILGTWIGASAYDTSLAAFMLGLGAGAIAQVVVQIAPSLRDRAGRLLDPLIVGGLLSGLLIMYATGLLVSV
jgi:ZIP family zinc transporter